MNCDSKFSFHRARIMHKYTKPSVP